MPATCRAAVLIAAVAFAAPLVAAAQAVGPADPNAPPKPAAAPAADEAHREAAINGVLTIYGNQRCPTDSSGAEVVVCVRRSAAEQFRIPKDLREFKVTPQNESWAKGQAVALAAGAQGVGQCNTIGAGAGTGCLGQQIGAARAEAADRKKDATPDLSGY